MDLMIVFMVQTHSMPLAAAYRSTALSFSFFFDGHFRSLSFDLRIMNFKFYSFKLLCILGLTNEIITYVVWMTSFQLNPWTRYRSHVSAIFGLCFVKCDTTCNWWIHLCT